MRLSRLVPVLAAGALLVASTSPVQAQTEPVSGVGTTTGALTLLGLDAGDLLVLDLLTDAGSANIDEATGPRRAAAQIAALAVDSVAAGISQEVPLLQVESTGEPAEQSQAVTPISNPIASGTLAPLQLSALVDEAGATSLLSAGLGQLDVLSGIVSLAGSSVDLGSTALVGDAAGTRGVDVDALTVLDLEALLAALGIPLTDLPLDALLDLIDGLGLLPQLSSTLDGLGVDIVDLDDLSVDAVLGVVDDALSSLDTLDQVVVQLGGASAPVCQIIDSVLPGLPQLPGLPGLPTGGGTTTCTGTVADVTATLQQVTAQITALTDQLRAILEAPLDLLSGQALLSLDGLDVSVVTKATDDVGTSVADVTGTLGTLQVGELPVLGALDLTAPTDQLDGLLGQAEAQIGGVLGGLVPGVDLSDLIQIRTLEEATSVVEDAGTVTSSASFTGLRVDVLPVLGDVQALLGGLSGLESLGDVLGGLGLPIPTSGAVDVLALNTALAPVTDGLPLLGALAALEDGLGLQVATLSQQSTFTPVAASAPVAPATPAAPAAPSPSPAPALPRTGSDDTLLLALAGAAVLAALGGRHLVRRVDADA